MLLHTDRDQSLDHWHQVRVVEADILTDGFRVHAARGSAVVVGNLHRRGGASVVQPREVEVRTVTAALYGRLKSLQLLNTLGR